ncbi:FAD-linked oxidoreductase-like protein [Chytriomyces sp. MP71]|nr:FAD-linked oxidoreductase-like protein [Chytriomyces sp. MP71]
MQRAILRSSVAPVRPQLALSRTTVASNASFSTQTATAPTSGDPALIWTTPKWAPSSVRPYKDKSTAELLNSYTVFKLCEFPPLVAITPTLIDVAEMTGTKFLMNAAVKKTFFKHFCGGETIKEVLPTMIKMKQNNMGAILDLAMEADMETEAEPTTAEAKAASSHIFTLMKESVDIASETPGSFIAAKVTAYVPPGVLLRWTNTLRLVEEAFNTVKDSNGHATRATLMKVLNKTFPQLTPFHVKTLGVDENANIDWITLSDYFTFTNKSTRAGLITTLPSSVNSLLHPVSNPVDFETLDAVTADLASLMQYSTDKQVKVMVDAEQTYFQRAIDDISLSLCRAYNTSGNVVVFNTYQMYLKDGLTRLQTDLERASRAGWTFGVKIVRGAYMVSERERAQEMGYTDPINATIADTHACYNNAIDHLLANLNRGLEFVVASHNKSSVAKTVAALEKNGVSPDNKQISFAQLMGMQDATSVALAKNGYRVFKYVPYGPIDVTIPYLLRRAQENSSVLGGVGEDKRELVAELGRRMRSEK